MPAWGVVPDSPVFYWAGKAIKSRGVPRSKGSYLARINTTYSFSKLVIYKPVLNFELNDPKGMVGRHMHRLGLDIKRDAQAQAGLKTGALRKSIKLEHRGSPNGQTLKIGSNLHYALAHHEGTRPHIITPNPPNKVLQFSKGSRLIRTTMVRHPGTRANKYLSDQLTRHIR
jgi:hypothetical protein